LLICRTPGLTNHICRTPAVSQIRIFSMKNDHEKGFPSICFFLSSSPFTASFCQFLFFHFLSASLHLHPFLFTHECTLRAGECIGVSLLCLFSSHGLYEQMPGKCKARMHRRTVSHLVLLALLY